MNKVTENLIFCLSKLKEIKPKLHCILYLDTGLTVELTFCGYVICHNPIPSKVSFGLELQKEDYKSIDWRVLNESLGYEVVPSCVIRSKEEIKMDNGLIVTCEKIHPDAILPVRATPGSAGFDLYAVEDVELYPGDTKTISTGIRVKVPDGHLMYISSKSGLASKNEIYVLNSPGLVDSDYRGEVKVILHRLLTRDIFFSRNGYKEMEYSEPYQIEAYKIRKGDKIAQAVILPYPDTYFIEGEVDIDTERGTGGFGSSGR